VTRLSILLIAVVLIVGMASYGGRESYTLTITSTTGGSVITPGEGTFTLLEGATVTLVAGIQLGHRFVNWTGDVGAIANVTDVKTTIIITNDCSITANFEAVDMMVAAGHIDTVGLRSDGTAVGVGGGWDVHNRYGVIDIGSWTGIVQVAEGDSFTLGLRSDGTVVAVGLNDIHQCDVGGWRNIIQVATGRYHSAGLKSDGTVVAAGSNWAGQRNVSGWTNIMWIATGSSHTVGLKSDGTVVAVGWNDNGQCWVAKWMLLR
jgi:hypothetical protein